MVVFSRGVIGQKKGEDVRISHTHLHPFFFPMNPLKIPPFDREFNSASDSSI
jgi:hypothetical protein